MSDEIDQFSDDALESLEAEGTDELDLGDGDNTGTSTTGSGGSRGGR